MGPCNIEPAAGNRNKFLFPKIEERSGGGVLWSIIYLFVIIALGRGYVDLTTATCLTGINMCLIDDYNSYLIITLKLSIFIYW